MGCLSTCLGYELDANLDFDENGDGIRNDTYNTGAGWSPIGSDGDTYRADFDGGAYTISNLYININDATAGKRLIGLFAKLGADADVKNVGLPDADVTIVAANGHPIRAGALAGESLGSVAGSWSAGSVTAEGSAGGLFNQTGGLVGFMETTGEQGSVQPLQGDGHRQRDQGSPTRADLSDRARVVP